MSLVYLCLKKSGKWTIDIKRRATMPPYEALDGPFDYRVAQMAMKERNSRHGWPRKHVKEDRFDLWK